MDLFDNTDRLDDLIDQIDKKNVETKKRNVFAILFLIISFVGLVSYYFIGTTTTLAQESPKTHSPQLVQQTSSDNNNNIPSSEQQINHNSPAKFNGGQQAIKNYLKNSIIYPEKARQLKIEGKVLVNVTINSNGEIKKPTIVEGLGYGCDEEVIRVIKNMPKWEPAQINGKAIKKSYVLTVTFSLS